MHHCCIASLAIVILAFSCHGCGNSVHDPHVRQPVSGTVTLDGKPIVSGAITFFPSDNQAVASGAAIVDGKYTISKADGLPVGNYKVMISAPVIAKSNNSNPAEFPGYQEQIPQKYNTQTTLTCDVKPHPGNAFTFDLKSN